ncbi:hypothetical protein [Chryseobacterium carnipullorum]|uniref:Uncharacterized protein n=1 Tax=Chryseobacterium carnipullorum TaxID=1124835 RepID=A0A376DTU5_CHRCU|nr:hypothetical protein [Chryseobacterium carnipullorum]STC95568.1 Uncharacterised protein [Chryseobacterium carnipullorum]
MESYNTSFGKGVAATKASVSQLIAIIRNENSSLEQRKQAYDRLIAIDPTFRGTLDAQYRSTRRLGDALEYVTGKIDAFAMAQAKAAAARKYLEESFEEQFKAGALKTQVLDADAEAKRLRKLSDDAEKSGKASLDLLRKAIDAENKRGALSKKWREQQNIANEKGSISNTIIRNNNTEIAQKEKQLSLLEKEIKLGKLSGEVLELKKKQADKIKYELSGFKPEVITEEEDKAPNLGWAGKIKAQIDELEAQLDSAPTQAAYNKIKAKIKELNALLNPKNKNDNKQLAELFPEDSIKDLERDAQLITDALQTIENGVVKIRKLDKYGNDKDKKGNPLLTGEIVSVDEALRRRAEINARLDAKRKEIEVRSFEEEIKETKRQIDVRDELLRSGYSKETVDEMFPKVKDKSFLQYLNDLSDSLQKVQSKESGENLVKLQSILSDYRGSETFIENVNKQIEVFKSKFAGDELIDKLEGFKKATFENTTGEEKNAKNIAITKAQQAEVDRQKNLYQEFLNEEASFQKKKTLIQQKWDKIRADIAASSMSDEG